MFTQGYLTGKLLPKFGPIKLVIAGFYVITIAFAINALIAISPISLLTIPFILMWALGSGLFEPSFGGLLSGVAGPQEQGRVQGASQSMQSLTRILAPLLAAFLYQFNHSLPWISCVMFSLAGAIYLFKYKNTIASHLHPSTHH
jgi:DHA1 family tetracycline resistance protein-like MFS transporter